MLYDLRTYRCRPGTVAAQLVAYADTGFAVQRRHLGAPLYGTVETGDVNAYVHLWEFADAADRERRRAALYADQQWLAYRRRSAEAGLPDRTDQHGAEARLRLAAKPNSEGGPKMTSTDHSQDRFTGRAGQILEPQFMNWSCAVTI